MAWLRKGVAVLFLFSLGGFSYAADGSAAVPAQVSPAQRDQWVACQKFVQEKLHVWQQRLNLESWKVTVLLSRRSDLKPKTLGNIHWDADTMTATIRVQDPADYKLPFKEMLEDMEFTVVHELVHLQLSSLPRSQASRRAEEHAVNQITESLLKLARYTCSTPAS